MANKNRDPYMYNVPTVYKEEWFPRAQSLDRSEQHCRDLTAFLKTFIAEDDAVFVCSFPRSGTHLVWTIVHMLVQGHAAKPLYNMEDFHIPRPLTQALPDTDRKIYAFHMLPCDLREENFSGKRRFIRIVRNPKDTCVSWHWLLKTMIKETMAHPEDWNEFMLDFIYGKLAWVNWVQNIRGWEEFEENNPNIQVLTVQFEEVIQDWTSYVKRIAEFLEISVSEDLLNDITSACQFHNMKTTKPSEWIVKLMPGKDTTFFRKGKIGDWRECFTVAQNEQFNQIYQEQMCGSRWQHKFDQWI